MPPEPEQLNEAKIAEARDEIALDWKPLELREDAADDEDQTVSGDTA